MLARTEVTLPLGLEVRVVLVAQSWFSGVVVSIGMSLIPKFQLVPGSTTLPLMVVLWVCLALIPDISGCRLASFILELHDQKRK